MCHLSPQDQHVCQSHHGIAEAITGVLGRAQFPSCSFYHPRSSRSRFRPTRKAAICAGNFPDSNGIVMISKGKHVPIRLNQCRPRRLLIKATAHKRLRCSHAETGGETPAKQLPIAQGHEKTPTLEGWCCPDERLHGLSRFPHRMARRPYHGGIAAETALVLDDRGAPLGYSITQFPAPVVAVDVPTDLITGVEIGQGGWPHHVPGDLAS